MTSKTSTKKSNPIKRFFIEALEEYGKITWPTKEQAILLTSISVIVSIIVVLIIGLLDLSFAQLYKLALDNL